MEEVYGMETFKKISYQIVNWINIVNTYLFFY